MLNLWKRSNRAASLTGYGLIVGLIAIVAIAALRGVGEEVNTLFGTVSTQMESVTSGVSGGGDGDPLAVCVAAGVGTECADGSYFVGFSPEDGLPVFMTSSAYQSDEETWDNGAEEDNPCYLCGDGSTGASSTTDGRANVEALRDYNDPTHGQGAGGLSWFNAARYCDDLEAHGHTDWYLPAGGSGETELNLLREMVQAVGAVDGVTGSFWSSREHSAGFSAYSLTISSGIVSFIFKSNIRRVRCVRR